MGYRITSGVILKLWAALVLVLLVLGLVLWLGGTWGPVLWVAKWLLVAVLVLPVPIALQWLFEAFQQRDLK